MAIDATSTSYGIIVIVVVCLHHIFLGWILVQLSEKREEQAQLWWKDKQQQIHKQVGSTINWAATMYQQQPKQPGQQPKQPCTSTNLPSSQKPSFHGSASAPACACLCKKAPQAPPKFPLSGYELMNRCRGCPAVQNQSGCLRASKK